MTVTELPPDLGLPALAIWFGRAGPTPEATQRKRFYTTTEAVRFVIEELAVSQQVNASLVFDDGSFIGVERIIALYKSLPSYRRGI